MGQQQQQQTKAGQKLANASALRWTWKAGRLEIGTEKRVWRHYHQGWLGQLDPGPVKPPGMGLAASFSVAVGWVREENIWGEMVREHKEGTY